MKRILKKSDVIAAIEHLIKPSRNHDRDAAIKEVLETITALPDANLWQAIHSAKKDGNTIIWACLHPAIYPELEPNREDLKRWNGVQVPIRHPGIAKDGFDIGWNIAAPVGQGGFPDEWIVGWQPLPAPPRGE